MHHCNVDRLLSLWAALNPTVWVTANVEQNGTWTIPNGAKVDENTRAYFSLWTIVLRR